MRPEWFKCDYCFFYGPGLDKESNEDICMYYGPPEWGPIWSEAWCKNWHCKLCRGPWEQEVAGIHDHNACLVTMRLAENAGLYVQK